MKPEPPSADDAATKAAETSAAFSPVARTLSASKRDQLHGATLPFPVCQATGVPLPPVGMVEQNKAASDYPQDECLHELFEEQAERTPEAVALVFEGQTLTYRELNARANQIAHHLRSLGVGPDVLVGLCVERSLEMVVALLAILKAGGAYLPLDPVYPPERLAFMIEDAQTPVIVTQRQLASHLPAHQATVVYLDDLPPDDPSLQSAANLENLSSPAHLAYVIFTSGSTGQPKGVLITHHNVVRLMLATDDWFHFDDKDVWTLFHSYAFDFSVWEIWGALLYGGKLVVVPYLVSRSPDAFYDLLAAEKVTVLNQTPSAFQQLAQMELSASAPRTLALRYVIFGGEALVMQSLKPWFERHGDTFPRLVNMYGITETTVHVTYRPLTKNDIHAPSLIGVPIPDLQVHILDVDRQPVPVGATGELFVGGAGLARGYLNRPDLTAERFIPNPFSRDPDARLYKTGDLACRRSDGDIEYRGRKDEQVKIRGFRIELGEIELVLGTHSGVRNCAVAVQQDGAGDKFLAAFVVARDAVAVSAETLRTWLRQKLPDYMIPVRFVALEALPLTPNGKLDRKSLEKLEAVELVSGTEYVAPRNERERELAEIWQAVLGRERVGIRDNFLDLGGHSLLAVRVVARIRETLGMEMSLRTLFEFPTIADLAGALPPLQGVTASPILPLAPVARTGALPLSYAQKRLWFHDWLEGKTTAYHLTEALRLRGELNRTALEQALHAIAARHESLRTRFVEVDGELVQVVDQEPHIGWKVESLLMLSGEAQEEAITTAVRRETEAPFDLSRGPLLRVSLIQLGEREHLLIWTFHHIVSDGWSMGIFNRELAAMYQACCEGRNALLKPLPVQYADFALWQRQQLEGERLARLLDYWTRKLADAPPSPALATDRPRPSQRDPRGESRTLDLPAELAASISALCQREGVTLFMGLLAAFKVLLARHSGQEDIVIGSPTAGRDSVATEGLIGFFVNALVVRSDLSGNPTFLELLERVRATVLDAFAHEELPFDKLVEALNPTRDLSRHGVVQVFFNVLSYEAVAPCLAGLEVERLALPETDTNFDLTMYVTPAGGKLRFRAVYSAALFDGVRMEMLLDQWQHLLRQVAENPRRPIHSYSLRTSQTERLLPDPTIALAEPLGVPVFRQFLEVAFCCPAQPALRQDGREWTYQELADASRRIAKRLAAGGVQPGDVVAVSGRRSFGLVAGLLGVLGARGVLLLIDPALPSARRDLMLQEACARHWVHVDEGREEDKNWSATFRAIPTTLISSGGACLNSGGERIGEKDVLADASPNDPAYVFFTSGTSGKPKAILGSQKGLSHFIDWERERLGVVHRDRVAQLTGLSFDVVLRDIFLPLTSGATLCLPAEGMLTHGDRLVPWLKQEGITILHAVPSLAQAWLESLPSEAQVPTLRWVLFAGEALTDQLIAQWRSQVGPSAGIINLYGPTETTLAKCFQVVPEKPAVGTQPIGRPLPHTQSLVLNQADQLCGIGEPGEIAIRTPFRSLGYLNASDRDRARFAPNPFRDDPADVIYRTGDRGVYAHDGTLLILGRCDDQLKIRGARVEPGEVSAVLAEHKGIHRCFVMARAEPGGENCLVAYIIPVDLHCAPDVKELRDYLKQKLPDYMIPSRFVALESLPLTPNGKVDRKALAKLDAMELPSGTAYIAPRNEQERVIAGIWEAVLHRERVGVYDNFFELGGHSLLALTLLVRMRQAGLHTDVRTLFATPNVAGLAAAVESEGRGIEVPPNRIPPACEVITPEMLPLVQLTFADIERIAGTVPGGAGNIQDIYPLAPLQEGILFHHRIASDGDPYLLSSLYSFDSRARLEQYLKALQNVIDRHDILRTAFLWEGLPEPVQVVWRQAPLTVEEVNLPMAAGDVAGQLRTRFDPRHYRVDVRRAPLLRVFITHDAAKARWLMLQLSHHLWNDHATQAVMTQEIQAYLRGQAGQLPDPLPYRNFVAQARGGVSKEEHEAFFRNMLGDVVEPTTPFGLTDVRGDALGITEARCQVEATLATRLRARARTLGVSAASVCHLAWAQVLARVSGRDQVVFGTVLLGRMQSGAEAERVMGLFINTLPICIRVGEAGAQDSVRQTHALLGKLLRHEHAPLALAQRCSAVTAPTPLFSALLNYRHGAPTAGAAEALQAEEGIKFLGSEVRTNYPLTLAVDEFAEGFSLRAQVKAPIDPHRVCAFMHNALEQLVGALENSPTTPLGDLPILPESERQQMLVEWNNTAVEYPRDKCLYELLEEQVERSPEAVAAVFEGQSLTYRELNTRANRLAWHLRSLGVGPEVLVGLCVERSLEMVIGLVGILKAGGAYVPLDPEFPVERLALIVEDAAAPLLLTQRNLAGRIGKTCAQVVCLDELVCQQASENPAIQGAPSQLAYVIYTSGSTGRPKGVEVTHQALVNCLCHFQRSLALGPHDAWLAVTTQSFDIAGLELLLPLLAGARVIVATRATARDAKRLTQALLDEGATVMQATPATWQMLLHSGWPGNPDLQILCGGEALPQALADRLAVLGSRAWNLYGPTETTIYSTTQLLAPNEPVTIGRPLANTRVYVFDSRNQIAPIGVAGELCIGGDGVARGYHNQPELTAERFIPDPFSSEPGARLYRTGDLARWLPDGNLEFLGRLDAQVKIRGFRIELGEIETTLNQHPGIRESIVVVREETPGDKRLAAYVLNRNGAVNSSELREFLRSKLPDYMIPAHFVTLEAFPLTPNHKVDRKALPKPELESPTEMFVAPGTPTEIVLAGVWCELLGLKQVGIHHNFFELGGHSLLAVGLCSQIHRRLSLEAPLRWIFEHPTIEELAKKLEHLGKCSPNAHPIGKADRQKPLPMSFAQQGMWLLHQTVPDPATYNQPVAWRLIGSVNREKVRLALQALLERHEVLRTALLQQGESLVQKVAPAAEASLPWQEVDLQGEPTDRKEEALKERLAEEARRPFDLSRAPLWRAVWIKLADQDQALALIFHHSIVDEWSVRLFFQELARLYVADGLKERAGLPELPVQYADYAAWQRQRLSGEFLEQQRNYWKEQLRDLPPALELPADGVRPLQPSGRGAVHCFQIPADVATKFRSMAQQEKTTLFTVLIAAFQVWLHRCTGQDDIVVGTPITARKRMELQDLLGLFLNTLPIRAKIDGSIGFRQVLRQVRETLLGAFSHAELPFEQMVEISVKERKPGEQPLFQVMFVLLEEGLPALCLDQAQDRVVPMRNGTSKSDLTLHIQATGHAWDCQIEYATDLFSEQAAARMARHLTELLRSVAENPEQPVCRSSIMSKGERQQLLVEWNKTTRDYPRDKCIHQLFAEQVKLAPEAVAVVYEGISLTYRELNTRANHLAGHLQKLGVGPGELVGLRVERSLEMVIAALGILKAGGAYWALEENLPEERLRLMLADAKPRVLLVRRKPSKPAAAIADMTSTDLPNVTLTVAAIEDLLESSPPQAAPSAPRCSAMDPAYVSYTSGSAGRPKGVVVLHRGVVRLVKGADYVSLNAQETLLQLSPLSFDASTFEIWGALLNGGRVVLMPPGPPTLAEIGQAIREHGVTTLWLTAGLFHLMVDEHLDDLKPLRQLLAGGDVLSPARMRKARRALPGCRIINGYGPTENTTFTCCFTVAGERELSLSVPIGRPIANTRVYVLDAHLEPVPVGVVGELYAGGDGVARGYLNQPELTAERFIRDPFSSEPAARLYRTGDLARWLPDGNLEFLGRSDAQVKIRGFRIELGEIETTLNQHPGIRESIVVAREETPGDKRLAAYVVSRNEAVSAAGLREFLRGKLPDYMIPAHFVTLEALPLTPNGKVNRQALPAPETGGASAPGDNSQPINLLELELTRIWRRLFQREAIGRRDNFFDLGGHSLLAAQLAVEIDKLLGRKLSIATLFQSPTIELLAQRLTDEKWAPLWSSLVPLQPRGRKPPLFFVHGWGGAVYQYLDLTRLLPADQPVFGIQAVGLDGKTIRHISVEEMAAHYAKEIVSFQPGGQIYLAGYSLGGVIAFEIARQLHQQGRRVGLLALIDTYPTGAVPFVFWGFEAWLDIFVAWRSRLVAKLLFHWKSLRELSALGRYHYLRTHWKELIHSPKKQKSKVPAVTAPPDPSDQNPQIPGFKDYYHAVSSSYRLQPYFGKADAFVGENTRNHLRWYWRYLTRGRIRFYKMPGSHLQFISSPENLSKLAPALARALHHRQEKERSGTAKY